MNHDAPHATGKIGEKLDLCDTEILPLSLWRGDDTPYCGRQSIMHTSVSLDLLADLALIKIESEF
jgi:hypothetical protein